MCVQLLTISVLALSSFGFLALLECVTLLASWPISGLRLSGLIVNLQAVGDPISGLTTVPNKMIFFSFNHNPSWDDEVLNGETSGSRGGDRLFGSDVLHSVLHSDRLEGDGSGHDTDHSNRPHRPNNHNHQMLGIDNTVFSEVLFQIQGMLEQGDLVAFQDGSLYDEYPINGNAGQSLLITLESNEFDAYLVVLNDNGDIIAHNDDVSPGNTNSSLLITLPESDGYVVVASGFKRDSHGPYRLTIWTSEQENH